MRYEDWDILLFPRDCKVPLKEFKVACHMVHDTELSYLHGSLGLPTVCCFVPSLPTRAPYKLSIHSWSTPPISQFTRSYGKTPDRVVFEARLFVDGRLVSSSPMNRAGPWPNVLRNSFDLSDNGELDSLSFPSFQRELLNQNYWSPADDLGRIKVVISESYPRDSISMPLERIKNVVAFSFQHAPLVDILETSGIAWPNPSMWRSMPFTSSLPSKQPDDPGSHAHSPRPRYNALSTSISLAQATSSNVNHGQASKQRTDSKLPVVTHHEYLPSIGQSGADPFVEANAYFEWLSGIGMGLSTEANVTQKITREGRKSSTDTSMPDYVSATQTPPLVENAQGNPPEQHDEDADLAHSQVPTNTPTTGDRIASHPGGISFSLFPANTPISVGLGDSMNTSILSQSTATPPLLVPTPAMEVKSRKENKLKKVSTPPSTTLVTNEEPLSVRKVSQPLGKASGNTPQKCDSAKSGTLERSMKRSRNFTPSSAKAFEEDEEPRRASPRVRLSAFDEASAA